MTVYLADEPGRAAPAFELQRGMADVEALGQFPPDRPDNLHTFTYHLVINHQVSA
jgi:hypothetical protein